MPRHRYYDLLREERSLFIEPAVSRMRCRWRASMWLCLISTGRDRVPGVTCGPSGAPRLVLARSDMYKYHRFVFNLDSEICSLRLCHRQYGNYPETSVLPTGHNALILSE